MHVFPVSLLGSYGVPQFPFRTFESDRFGSGNRGAREVATKKRRKTPGAVRDAQRPSFVLGVSLAAWLQPARASVELPDSENC